MAKGKGQGRACEIIKPSAINSWENWCVNASLFFLTGSQAILWPFSPLILQEAGLRPFGAGVALSLITISSVIGVKWSLWAIKKTRSGAVRRLFLLGMSVCSVFFTLSSVLLLPQLKNEYFCSSSMQSIYHYRENTLLPLLPAIPESTTIKPESGFPVTNHVYNIETATNPAPSMPQMVPNPTSQILLPDNYSTILYDMPNAVEDSVNHNHKGSGNQSKLFSTLQLEPTHGFPLNNYKAEQDNTIPIANVFLNSNINNFSSNLYTMEEQNKVAITSETTEHGSMNVQLHMDSTRTDSPVPAQSHNLYYPSSKKYSSGQYTTIPNTEKYSSRQFTNIPSTEKYSSGQMTIYPSSEKYNRRKPTTYHTSENYIRWQPTAKITHLQEISSKLQENVKNYSSQLGIVSDLFSPRKKLQLSFVLPTPPTLFSNVPPADKIGNKPSTRERLDRILYRSEDDDNPVLDEDKKYNLNRFRSDNSAKERIKSILPRVNLEKYQNLELPNKRKYSLIRMKRQGESDHYWKDNPLPRNENVTGESVRKVPNHSSSFGVGIASLLLLGMLFGSGVEAAISKIWFCIRYGPPHDSDTIDEAEITISPAFHLCVVGEHRYWSLLTSSLWLTLPTIFVGLLCQMGSSIYTPLTVMAAFHCLSGIMNCFTLLFIPMPYGSLLRFKARRPLSLYLDDEVIREGLRRVAFHLWVAALGFLSSLPSLYTLWLLQESSASKGELFVSQVICIIGLFSGEAIMHPASSWLKRKLNTQGIMILSGFCLCLQSLLAYFIPSLWVRSGSLILVGYSITTMWTAIRSNSLLLGTSRDQEQEAWASWICWKTGIAMGAAIWSLLLGTNWALGFVHNLQLPAAIISGALTAAIAVMAVISRRKQHSRRRIYHTLDLHCYSDDDDEVTSPEDDTEDDWLVKRAKKEGMKL